MNLSSDVADASNPILRDSGKSRRSLCALNPQSASAFTRIDFDKPGRQIGFFHIPQSPDEDAWGTVRVPLAVLANGTGPTVALEAGNHGDEYEGQIVLGELIRNLDLSRLHGRLIVVPAINSPAVDAGRRTSPLDGLNMNRVFPGDHAGSITQQIAAFVSDEVLGRSDALLTLHSGGSSMDIARCAMVQSSSDARLTQRSLEAGQAFGAPLVMVSDALGDTRTSIAAAVAAGLTCVGAEMAGTGSVSQIALDTCRKGVVNVLRHWGVLDGPLSPTEVVAAPIYRVPGMDGFVLAPSHGVFECFHAVGDGVETGQPVGLIHSPTDPGQVPVEVRCAHAGIVFARRHPGRIQAGNLCCVVATRSD
ncbi:MULTISPECIES: succinylglutamate desuccinylase/aspartoacylase family protein [Variovorax]|uniref:succinylglutamate desuccinylase/aspartoacylase family protein n=1 Tax=Variovorax TaxID=34072 RepID=UPI0003784E59|nr:succinylglutamate desuccinylase/aspartoacylase family protein [Variovorax paradoxus]